MSASSNMTAKEIAEARQALGISRQAMAARVGVVTARYEALESGLDRPSLLIENAIRYVALTGGLAGEDPCTDCNGSGHHSAPPNGRGYRRRIRRCPTCHGSGRAEPLDVERVLA